MANLRIYQICHNLMTYSVTLTSPKKVNYVLYLGPEGVLIILLKRIFLLLNKLSICWATYWLNIFLKSQTIFYSLINRLILNFFLDSLLKCVVVTQEGGELGGRINFYKFFLLKVYSLCLMRVTIYHPKHK